MDLDKLAHDLAEVCMKHEPPKKPGGSRDRQNWIRLIIAIESVFQIQMESLAFQEAFI